MFYFLLGAFSFGNTEVRYSKAQRPNSLPIQPFVLNPADKPQPQTQRLGCLLEQYINQKTSKSSSQPVLQYRTKSSQCFTSNQLSPMGSHCPIFLAAPSSSDTCSTCTPSPECLSWSQSSQIQGCSFACISKSRLDTSYISPKPGNQSNLVKNATYQDLVNLNPEQNYTKTDFNSPHQFHRHTAYHSIFSDTPPTLPLTTDAQYTNLHGCFSSPVSSQPENKFPQYRIAPPADSSFHSSFTAALSSVPPLSSTSSPLSLAACRLHPGQIQNSFGLSGIHNQSQRNESLSDRPAADFCLSLDTSYESMSMSHLQRRGEI